MGMVDRIHNAKSVAIVVSDDMCARRIAEVVQSSAFGSFSTQVLRAPEQTNAVSSVHPDILFLGVHEQFGENDAIGYVRSHERDWRQTQIIYVDDEQTATPDVYQTDHAYLLPQNFTDEQVETALQCAVKRLHIRSESPFVVRTRSGLSIVSPHEIYFVESDRRLLIIHMGEATLRTYGKISDLMQLLPQRFVQCHKSFVVNLGYVVGLKSEQITLANGDHVPVSQKRRKSTREALESYVGGRVA